MPETAPAVLVEVPEAMFSVTGGVALARRAYNHSVNVGEADVVAVKAVGFVYNLQPRVAGLDKSDIDALSHSVSACSDCKQVRIELTENRAAPWTASSTTWIVALSPAFTFRPAGSGT